MSGDNQGIGLVEGNGTIPNEDDPMGKGNFLHAKKYASKFNKQNKNLGTFKYLHIIYQKFHIFCAKS